MGAVGDFIRKMAYDAVPGDAGRKVSKALGDDGGSPKLAKSVKKARPLGSKRPDGRIQLMGDD